MDHETTQTATTHPTRPEAMAMIILAALLIINLAVTFCAANYEPDCVPAIIAMEEIGD